MREYTVRRGKYEGIHLVFESIDEAAKHNITKVFKPWFHPEVEPGDWVVSDDGYVVQCLDRRKLINKRHKSGQYTDLLRFPQGTFGVYIDKNGEKFPYNFYAALTPLAKNSLSKLNLKHGRFLTPRKKLFATLVASGTDLTTAYMKAYNSYPIGKTNIARRLNKLLSDPYIKEELMEQMKSLLQKVEESIKAKTGYDNLADFIANTLADVASDPDATIKDKLALVKELKSTFALQLGLESPKKNIKEIQEASFEEVKPPQLGEKS